MSRSRWKVPFVSPFFLKNSFEEKYISFNTYNRNSTINFFFVDKKIRVYNGKKFISFIVSKNMVGKKIGEFSLSKVMGSAISLSVFSKKKKKKKKKK